MTLFNNIFIHYNYRYSSKESITFGLLQHAAPVLFDVEQNITNFILDSKTISIHRKGVLNDPRSRVHLELAVGETNFIDLGQKATGSFDQKILLDMKNHTIDSIHLRMAIDLQTPRSVEVKVERI